MARICFVHGGRETRPVNTKASQATIIRGGRVLDFRAHRADGADVLIAGDTITEIGAPGLPAPPDATGLDARGLLLHPGLINAHTHAHGNLAKGMGDRWTSSSCSPPARGSAGAARWRTSI